VKFGAVATAEAEGTLLAHTVRLPDGALKKGHRLTPVDVARLIANGIDTVVAARLDARDCHEDTAADRLARAAAGGGLSLEPPFTGRVNLHAEADGILVVSRDAVDALNRIDPAITFATLPAFARVTRGRMVATAKIIPFAVAEPLIAEAERRAAGAVRLAPFRARDVGLVATVLPHVKESVLDKTRRITEARLAVSGSRLIGEARVAHAVSATAEALRAQVRQGVEMLLVFGASAIVDIDDVIPTAIRAAGGRIVHFGMPVDPGNLLLIGDLDGIPVIGAPGCARSPKENGFDWVLDRLMADCTVTADDIMGMGVGGLLMEIGSRPQPRARTPAAAARARKVAGVLLAAGQARRAGGVNKLLARLNGTPLVRIAAQAALDSGLSSLTVVTGHEAPAIAAALDGLNVTLVHNPDFAEGMAGSLRTGVQALPAQADAAVILLADMPFVSPADIDALIAAYRPEEGRTVVVSTVEGKRGNPVLWDRSHFEALTRLEGDTGARHLIEAAGDHLARVEIGAAARQDLDTRAALDAVGAQTALDSDRD